MPVPCAWHTPKVSLFPALLWSPAPPITFSASKHDTSSSPSRDVLSTTKTEKLGAWTPPLGLIFFHEGRCSCPFLRRFFGITKHYYKSMTATKLASTIGVLSEKVFAISDLGHPVCVLLCGPPIFGTTPPGRCLHEGSPAKWNPPGELGFGTT